MWLCCQQNSAMWLFLISCHLQEHGEFEFSCARTALAPWPTFCFSKNSPVNPHECQTIHAVSRSSSVRTHARISASLLQIIPEPNKARIGINLTRSS